MDKVDLLLAPLPQEFLDPVTTIDKGGGHGRRGGRLGYWRNQRTATFIAEFVTLRIRMSALRASFLANE
jgi:hypothetical protein